MGSARQSRGVLSPDGRVRNGGDGREPHLGARSRHRQRVPHQPVRHAVRGDDRVVDDQDRHRRQRDLQRDRLRREPGGLRDPQRGARRAARRRLHHPYAHSGRHGGLRDDLRNPADRAVFDALHRHRLPRLRRRGAAPGRARAPGEGPGESRGDGASQSRAPHHRREHTRVLQQYVPARARLRASGDGALVQHEAPVSSGRSRPVHQQLDAARRAAAHGPPRVACAAAQARPQGPVQRRFISPAVHAAAFRDATGSLEARFH